MEIISYKHNGALHRVWQSATFVRQTDNAIVLVNNRVNVIDGDGHLWKTKEPAVCYFFKQYWFNVICMLRNDSIYYYCNLSSPYVIDKEGLKYIDYELDVKVFPSGDKLVLDRDEFEFNRQEFHYSSELVDVIERQLKALLEMIERGISPFNKECVEKDYEIYRNQKNLVKNIK